MAHREMLGQLRIAAVQFRVIPARFGDARLQIIGLLCPIGLCGRRAYEALSRTWNPACAAETGHITQLPEYRLLPPPTGREEVV